MNAATHACSKNDEIIVRGETISETMGKLLWEESPFHGAPADIAFVCDDPPFPLSTLLLSFMTREKLGSTSESKQIPFQSPCRR
jgi:hypothetical protein